MIINDDEELQSRLESVVRKCGMSMEGASTREALHAAVNSFDSNSFSTALIVDGTDGKPAIEYAANLLQHDPHISCVLIMYAVDQGMLLRALRLHVCDVLTQPVSEGELLHSVEKAIRLNRHKRLAFRTSVQAREMTRIHRRLMTGNEFSLREFRPDFRKRVETAFLPASDAGGDFGRCVRLDDDRLLLLSGDTSGHDIKAGFVSAYFLGLFRGMLTCNATPEMIFNGFNSFLINVWNAGCLPDEVITSIGVSFILLDFKQREIHCSCNGVPSPLLCNEFLEVQELGGKNPPLGWFEGPLPKPTVFAMPDSGAIVTHTDGLADIGDGGLCRLGLADAILGLAPESSALNALFENQTDDIFVQRFIWDRQLNQQMLMLRPICHVSIGEADLARIDAYQEQWDKTLLTILPGLSRLRRREILLCAREAVLNAIEHGSPAEGKGRCGFTMAILEHNRLRLGIKGCSEQGENRPAKKPAPHIPFGLKIIRGYADSLVYDEKQNRLLLDFNLTSRSAFRSLPVGDENESQTILS